MTAPPASAARNAWRWGDVDACEDGPHFRLTHATERAELLARDDGRLVRGRAYAQASPSARRALARAGAILRLRRRGRYLVHASGAVDPAGRAWLLAGDSGGGKSTLAYALARGGWGVLGDDAVLLEVPAAGDAGGVVALPWRDALRVSSRLAPDFPELSLLAPHAATGDPRLRVAVPAPIARRAPLRALVFVTRAEREAIVPLRGTAALAALVRQSPWVILDDADARTHLAALTRVVSAVPAFRLEHTPEALHSIARTLAEALP